MSELFAAMAGAVIGAVTSFFVARWAARDAAQGQHYVHTDALYITILKLYLDYPDFGLADKTNNYATAFGDDAQRYAMFASLVHNFLETIYDLFYDAKTNGIHPQWSRIFAYHALLHAKWLANNDSACEPAYVAFVKARYG